MATHTHARRHFSRHDAWITVCARRRDGVVRARLRAAADGRLDLSSLVTGGNFFLATGTQPTQRAPDDADDDDEDEDETDELIAMHLYHDEELEAGLEEEEEDNLDEPYQDPTPPESEQEDDGEEAEEMDED